MTEFNEAIKVATHLVEVPNLLCEQHGNPIFPIRTIQRLYR